MPGRIARVTAALATAALLSGCALVTGRPTIQELKYNPGRYHDRTVAIDGVVTGAWGLPVVGKVYKIDDGTGKIWVATRRGVPSRGTRVGAKGYIHSGFSFAGRSFGTVLEETDRRSR